MTDGIISAVPGVSEVEQLLERANMRQLVYGIGGVHPSFDDYFSYQVRQVISGLWLRDAADEAPKSDGSSAGVKNVREILTLPEIVLDAYGPEINLLRGYLAEFDGDQEAAFLYFDAAQSGYLAEGLGDAKRFSIASKKLGEVATTLGMEGVAEIAGQIAEQYNS